MWLTHIAIAYHQGQVIIYPVPKYGSVKEKATTWCNANELYFGALIPTVETAGSFWTAFIITTEPRVTYTEKMSSYCVYHELFHH